jgi:alkanesulfonate monooxygenase SsuD/methylene tetrahydromethanopterin reductase-like flavin-dependent oxidoreductase (luciferase family)
VRFGFVLPGGTATQQLEQAVLAEDAGWDGIFVWEAAYGVDAWSLLAAIAARTERIRLGTLLTPLPWRRPWKVASQAATLDQLSNGRAILAVGLGATTTGLDRMGEITDRRIRAEMLDEGIDLIHRLWEGELKFSGRHCTIDLSAREDLHRVGHPVQRRRIPIWAVGAWPRPRSMRRVVRCDGLLPVCIDSERRFRPTTPKDIRAMWRWLEERGKTRESFDVIAEGETPTDDAVRAAAIVGPWAETGCTWWIETRWQLPHESDARMREVRQRLLAGPPTR